MTSTTKKQKNILFLLRTYNDIDHIAPIIWKAGDSGCNPYFVFVDKDYCDDYRIQFLLNQGASRLDSATIKWYYTAFRPYLCFRIAKRIFDRLAAYSLAVWFLFSKNIDVVVNEWSGRLGRARAEYYLRAAEFLRLPIYSFPHGFFIFTNYLFTRKLKNADQIDGQFPEFSDRDCFTKYVVQSREHKELNIKWGMYPDKIVVLGSARFCKEWSDINCGLLCDTNSLRKNGYFTVLFFLPHWEYNVHRDECIALLIKISDLSNVCLQIKAHTRGSGGLDLSETILLDSHKNVEILDESDHSTLLVTNADVVVNFGSSIAFEALRQGKPVVNPRYLHDNETFFDNSKVVIDTQDAASTVRTIADLQVGRDISPRQDDVEKFLSERVDGPLKNKNVLETYVDLLIG